MNVGDEGRDDTRDDRPTLPRAVMLIAPCLALAWLILAGPISSIDHLRWQFRTPMERFGEDSMSLLLERYALIRDDLGDATRVGYLSDVTTIRKARFVDYLDEHVLGRALMPVVVMHSARESLVVANFKDSEQGLADAESRGLTVLRSYGDGLYLLVRKP